MVRGMRVGETVFPPTIASEVTPGNGAPAVEILPVSRGNPAWRHIFSYLLVQKENKVIDRSPGLLSFRTRGAGACC